MYAGEFINADSYSLMNNFFNSMVLHKVLEVGQGSMRFVVV